MITNLSQDFLSGDFCPRTLLYFSYQDSRDDGTYLLPTQGEEVPSTSHAQNEGLTSIVFDGCYLVPHTAEAKVPSASRDAQSLV
jgi:hypothetical protein